MQAPRHGIRWKPTALVLAVLVLAVAAVFTVLSSRSTASADRGDPDPGGHRMAAIETAAAQLIPSAASHVAMDVHGFHWGVGGCDGGPAGWTIGEVDVTFKGPADLPALVSSQLASPKWRTAPEPLSSPSEPTAAQNPNTVATYIPTGSNPYGEQAVLSHGQHGGWDLWVTADPAVNPDHSC